MDVMSSSRRKTEASRPPGSYGCIHSTTEASPLVAGPESHAWKTVKPTNLHVTLLHGTSCYYYFSTCPGPPCLGCWGFSTG